MVECITAAAFLSCMLSSSRLQRRLSSPIKNTTNPLQMFIFTQTTI